MADYEFVILFLRTLEYTTIGVGILSIWLFFKETKLQFAEWREDRRREAKQRAQDDNFFSSIVVSHRARPKKTPKPRLNSKEL